MYRNASAIVFFGVAVGTLPVWGQTQPVAERGLEAQPPQSAAAQANRARETFDQDPVSGWEFRGKHAFVPVGAGRALATKGPALWVAAGEVSDFTMKIRYGYERGIATVDFRNASRYGLPEGYVLLLSPSNVHLIRVQRLAGKVEEREIASAPFLLEPKVWHDVIIQAVGGKINVGVDGKTVLDVNDPQPIPAGMCGVGVESGVVLYDEVSLISRAAQDTPGEQSLISDPATWKAWSEVGGAK
jgi:hypothetical protein